MRCRLCRILGGEEVLSKSLGLARPAAPREATWALPVGGSYPSRHQTRPAVRAWSH